jgi:phage terminase large subunit-like protein
LAPQNSGFASFLEAVANDDFAERPVDLQTFLYSEDFLGLPPLSEYQIKLLESMTQIYRKDTLARLYGADEADRLWRSTHQEIIFQLGKGSGKDFVTSVGFARIVYLLLCLKDPAKYFGKPPGDSIALLNVAINAKQAKNVFFRYFKQRIKLCPWFDGKWDATQDSIVFDKNVEAHSGHSEREAWEGYNFLVVVLDEIAGFATEAESTADGGSRDKTADAIYKMYKASVSSRFPRFGKLLLLSFPRYKGDYIQTRYNAAVAERHTVIRSHKFKVHEDLPDGTEGNEFDIEWEEDQIVSYTEDGVYALRRPTWEVNPIIDINDLKSDFLRDREDALSRFACMPPNAVDAFFKDRDRIEQAFPSNVIGPFRDDWSWRAHFKPDKERSYYLHVDLAYKHDRAAVAMASVDRWATIKYGDGVQHTAPVVRIDAVRYWTPTATQNVDLEEVKNFVVSLKRAGFPIKLVTFDRWNSVGYRQQLQSDFHIKTDLLSVAKPHYEDFALAMNENRLRGYDLPLLTDELVGLRIIRGNKVDHPRKGSKDVSDAVVGAVYNAIDNEHGEVGLPEIEISVGAPSAPPEHELEAVLPSPRASGPMPEELAKYLERMKVI